MGTRTPASPSSACARRFCALLATVLCAAGPAHESLEHYAQFTLRSRFQGENLDTEVQIVFSGERAMQERARMDSNRDGTIAPLEVAAYLMTFEEAWQQGFSLLLNGRPMRVLPLFAPEADLQAEAQVIPHPLILRFSCFARPSPNGAPEKLRMENTLFPDTPAIIVWDVYQGEPREGQLLGRLQHALSIKEMGTVRESRVELRLKPSVPPTVSGVKK